MVITHIVKQKKKHKDLTSYFVAVFCIYRTVKVIGPLNSRSETEPR
jgi:hypothetical protein